MNTQMHETTGHSPYELVFGQKPRPVVFGGVEGVSMANEEDLEVDGIIFEDMVSACMMKYRAIANCAHYVFSLQGDTDTGDPGRDIKKESPFTDDEEVLMANEEDLKVDGIIFEDMVSD